ncbi:MAG: hypothetical protein KAX49_11850 [Halanaerobiales bacterium]|nr:hypothetical protein [Halanaerobiales bacterium]
MRELVNATLTGGRESRPSVKLKLRENETVKYSTVKGIYPYFYINSYEKVSFPIIKRESGFYSYLNESLDKISFNTIKQLVDGRRNVDNSHESDINYLTRFLVDSNLTYSLNRRILYFDIEVEWGEGSLDVENAPQPITIIDAYDSFTQRHYPFTIKEYAEKGVDAFVFPTEKKMLNAFFSFYDSISPDVIIGWNSNNYDLPMLFNRSKENNGMFEQYHKQVMLRDSQPLDLMYCYRTYSETGGRSSLDHVASLVLGKRKNKSLPPLSHCIEDVTFTKEIDEGLKLSQLVFAFQNIVPLNTIDVMNRSNIIETFMLKKFHNRYVLPNKKHVEHKKYKGAIVRDPQKGLHKVVSVLDITSMYPSIVMHSNISPDRKLRNPGIITETIQDLFKTRMIHKREYQKKGDTQSAVWNTSYKFLLNAIIGMYGFGKSRFYDRELASEVTGKERELLTHIWNFVEEKGIEILSGDTDSAFVTNVTLDKKVALVDDINRMLHKEWGKEFNIELDKQFKVLFLYDKKKNYFGLTDNGNLKVTGTVANRTSCPLYLRYQLRDYFKLILEGKSTKKLKSEVIKNIRKEEIMDVAEWTRLSSVDPKVQTAHLKAAKQRLKLYRIPFAEGEKLPIVPTKDSRIGYLAIHEDIINKLPEIDYDAILGKWFFNPIREIENVLAQRNLGGY